TIVEAFVVVVVGGLGSIAGAYVAAVLVAVVQAFGIVVVPKATLVLVFLVMAAVLVIRPHGLFGRAVAEERAETVHRRVSSPGNSWRYWLPVVALLISLPLVTGGYTLTLATEMLVLALFAASLHFVMGPGGMASFGHAAFFGLGAYA